MAAIAIPFDSPPRPIRRGIRPAPAAAVIGRDLERKADSPDWPGIVRRCLGGDHSAWNELVELEYKRIYALCRRLGGSAEDAQDLTQEVFLKVYNSLASFDPARGHFRTWITTITRNQVVDHFRRTRCLRLTDSFDESPAGIRERDNRGWGDHAGALADYRRSPHDEAVREELAGLVERALVRLRPELREPIVLRDLEELDYKEIAQILEIPEGTVKSRISRGRAELARLLQRNRKQVM